MWGFRMVEQKATTYTLKHFDSDVLKLKIIQNGDVFELELIELVNKKLLPLDMLYTKESIKNWILNRLINKNKCNLDALLLNLEMVSLNKSQLINLSKCLSFIDPYWLKSSTDKGFFNEYNFYDKPLIKKLANISFDANDYYYLKKRNCSPELTTISDFRTCWLKEKGVIYLIKSTRTSQTAEIMQLHTEYLCFQIASRLGINCAQTALINYRKRLSLKQTLFLNKNLGYIRADRLIKSEKIKDIIDFCQELGENYLTDLKDMLLLDVITCNHTRSLQDFGFLVDNKTNTITSFAPLYRNASALFYNGFTYDINHHQEYQELYSPILGDSLLQIYKDYLWDTPLSKLNKLKDFKFNRNASHLLWEDLLLAIEDYLQNRIAELKDIIA